MTGWPLMIVMVGVVFLGFKVASLPRRRRLIYTFLWPGMDPQPFEQLSAYDPHASGMMYGGVMKMVLGGSVLLVALLADVSLWMRAWLMIGAFLLTLHMGLFDVLAGFWRRMGFLVERVCPEPWLSRSLSEFWGRRWNMAFHVFARERIYQPLVQQVGRSWALILVFLFSGIVHELVISFPAGGGWGLPTLYFALQGGLVWLEKREILRGCPLTTVILVVMPLPILFHDAFLANVIFPMVRP